MLTVTIILLACALISLFLHVTKPNVPIWPTVLFIIVVQLLQVIPIK
jgi:hypothetical protein